MLGLNVFLGNAFWRSLFLSSVLCCCSSCAGLFGPSLQPAVNELVASNNAAEAVSKLQASKGYGKNNAVLYELDLGLALQLQGNFLASTAAFEKAKVLYEDLYTRSVSNEASTWILNDNMSPYRASEYERVLLNVFQIFNYLKLDRIDDALVESRDLDAKFPVDIDAYVNKKRRFEDNGFARLLTGIVYELRGGSSDLSEALVAYKQSLALYDAYYQKTYVPEVLQEGLLRLSGKFNDLENASLYQRFGKKFPVLPGSSVVYFFEAMGFSPVKVSTMLPIPLEDGVIAKVAFPEFERRLFQASSSEVRLEAASGAFFRAVTELGVDIESLAEKDLASRKALLLSKGLLRPTAKYLIEHNQQKSIEKSQGVLAGQLFGLASSIFNFVSEQADVRSWQALPAQVRVSRLAVPAGVYLVRGQSISSSGAVLERWEEGRHEFLPGHVYCFFRRSVR